MTMFLGEFTLYGVITKQIFLICPKFEGKVASQSWKHCISSGKAANEETKKFLLGTLEWGRKLQLQFVGECSVDGSTFLKPVARTKVFL